MDSPGTRHLSTSEPEDEDLRDPVDYSPAEIGQHVDGRHLALILAFISHEVDQSAKMLRDLAAQLSEEFCAISQEDAASHIQHRLIGATMALQNEDRVQQRLNALRAILSVLERVLAGKSQTAEADLDHAIIDELHLDEIRSAFALSVGLADVFPNASSNSSEPSIGDIDLF